MDGVPIRRPFLFYTGVVKSHHMSVRMRHTRGHSGNRRSHHALTATKPVVTESGKLRLPHRLDEAAGTYRGKQIVEVKTKAVAAVKTQKSKATEPETHAAHAHEHDHAHQAEGKKGRVEKAVEPTRPRSRSGMGGGN